MLSDDERESLKAQHRLIPSSKPSEAAQLESVMVEFGKAIEERCRLLKMLSEVDKSYQKEYRAKIDESTH